jgi:hypothetical protein
VYAAYVNVGTVYAGEECIDLVPKYAPRSNTQPVMSFVHGAGSLADYCLNDYGNQSWMTMTISNVFPGIAGDNGGTSTWGNSTSLTRLGGNIARVQARPGSDPNKYGLMFGSMGGLISLNYAAQAAVKPKAIVGVIPVINTNDIVQNNRGGFAAAVNTAYGGAYNEATMGATSNPWTMRTAAKLLGIPMLFYYGTTDAICIPQFTTDFAAGDPTNRTLISMPSGHDETSYKTADPNVILNFLNAHLY